MAQLFHPAANTLAKGSIFAIVFGSAALGWVLWDIEQSPYVTLAGQVRAQPIPFSHEHHVRGLGIDCRYCHSSVEDSSFAGLPPTKTCMTCHSVIWTNAEYLEKVRQSWRNNEPIVWQRVHNLPGYVYFNHSIHVNKGIGCVSCHGRVDQMPIMYEESSLQMEWCLSCHRNVERFIRPRDQVFNLDYDVSNTPDPRYPKETQEQRGQRLMKEYHVLPTQQMQNCWTCHR